MNQNDDAGSSPAPPALPQLLMIARGTAIVS